jgi:plasmid stability protein
MARLPPIDAPTRAAIREGIEQAKRGEFVPDETIAASDKLHGIGLSAEQLAEVERRLAEPNPKTLTIDEFRTRLSSMDRK